MARLNIEDCWWTDPRRERLAALAGTLLMADAIAVRAWRIAQEFWGQARGLIPRHVFETIESHELLIQANLAEPREDGVYVRGSSQYLEWIHERREAARAGGKKSGEARRSKTKQTPSKRKQTQPSDSDSDSGSEEFKSISAVPDKSGPTATAPVKFKSAEELILAINPKRRETWNQLYPDQVFIKRETLRAFDYYQNKPSRLPRTVRGWTQTLSSWLERSWTQKLNQTAKTKAAADNFVVPD